MKDDRAERYNRIYAAAEKQSKMFNGSRRSLSQRQLLALNQNPESPAGEPGTALHVKWALPCADAATFGQSHQFGHGPHSHLLHHVGTMDFDRLLDSAEFAGNLFV